MDAVMIGMKCRRLYDYFGENPARRNLKSATSWKEVRV